MSRDETSVTRSVKIDGGLDQEVAALIAERVRLRLTIQKPGFLMFWMPTVATINGPAWAVDDVLREIQDLEDDLAARRAW